MPQLYYLEVLATASGLSQSETHKISIEIHHCLT